MKTYDFLGRAFISHLRSDGRSRITVVNDLIRARELSKLDPKIVKRAG